MAQADPIIKVQRGIPIPKVGRRGKPRYPWDKMRIGDSFFIEADDVVRAQNSISSAGCAWGRKHGGQFTTRTVEGGVWCWRISADD